MSEISFEDLIRKINKSAAKEEIGSREHTVTPVPQRPGLRQLSVKRTIRRTIAATKDIGDGSFAQLHREQLNDILGIKEKSNSAVMGGGTPQPK